MTFFSGIMCGNTGCEMQRQLPSGVRSHQRAEIISSQAFNPESSRMPPPPRIIEAMPSWRAANGATWRGGSLQAPNGTSTGSGSQPSGFHEVLGGHLACTAAALGQQDSPVPGRGLYVAMQRGMSYDTNGLHERPPITFEMQPESAPSASPRVMPRKLAKIRAESPGRMIAASNYTGCPEDHIDEAVAVACQSLPRHHAKALLIRRIAPGEYEVDGVPVRFTYGEDVHDATEVMVASPGLEHEGMEPLSTYLPRAAETAFSRAPPDLELPAFPWPFDLNKSTRDVPIVDMLSKTTVQRDALSISNVTNTVPDLPKMNPPPKTPSQMPRTMRSTSMVETTSYIGKPHGSGFSTAIPIGGYPQGRRQSVSVYPGQVVPPAMPLRPPGYLARR